MTELCAQKTMLDRACFDVKTIINEDNEDNEDLKSGMRHACIGGYVNVAKSLYYKGAPNLHEPINETCYRMISNTTDAEHMIKMMEQHRITTLIECLVYARDVNIINRLMSRHNTNSLNDELLIACENGNTRIVKLLIRHGANNYRKGLRTACAGGYVTIAKLIIQHGATNTRNTHNARNKCKKYHNGKRNYRNHCRKTQFVKFKL